MGGIMKISVITITYKDGRKLLRTVQSVHSQQLSPGVELEHIIVNGDISTPDNAYLDEAEALGSKVFHHTPKGCYDAINQGIKHATGDIIGLLHGNDIFDGNNILAKIAEVFEREHPDFVFGDIRYISDRHPSYPQRYYSASNFSPEMMRKGYAPPHPSLFVSANTARTLGDYNSNFIIAGDFEYFVRLFFKHKNLKWKYIPVCTTCMQAGGASAQLYNRLITNTREKHLALAMNGIRVSRFSLFQRYFIQFFKSRKSKSDK